MALTSRQRVRAALNHEQTDRPPFSWGFGPNAIIKKQLDEILLKNVGHDFASFRPLTEDIYRQGWAALKTRLPPKESIWGFTYKTVANAEGGSYEEFDYKPIQFAASTDDINNYQWPTTELYDYSQVAGNIRLTDPEDDHFIVGASANPFEILSWMMGLEETLTNMLIQPDIINAALRHITDFFVDHIHKTFQQAPGSIHGWFCADDLGSQQGPLISRDAYRSVLMPFHKEIFDAIHEHDAVVIYHSDGSCADLLPDLIEAGIDCLEAVQVECAGMSPENLKVKFGDQIAFHGAISVQQVLPRASEDEVRTQVRHLIQTLGRDGGYIAAPSHAIQDGTPANNVVAMLEAVYEKPLAEIVK
jgi:uroporphyrinogen decarboxylase